MPKKGGGGGKGVKGKGKNSLFDGECNECGCYGHTARFCPYSTKGAGEGGKIWGEKGKGDSVQGDMEWERERGGRISIGVH